MGLDQYLYAEKFLSGYEHNGQEEQQTYKTVITAVGLDGLACRHTPSATVRVTIAYWRKANAIHGWFVREVQGDTDDCGSYEVSREQLQELHDLAVKTLADYHAGKLNDEDAESPSSNPLAPVGGFFFGSTDIGESYAADLEDTINQLKPLLDYEDDGWMSFSYRSSW